MSILRENNMKTHFFLKTIAIIFSFSCIMACSSTPTKQEVGTVAGAATGAVIGSQFGSGVGKVAATAVGATAGAVAGDKIGESLEK